MAPSAARRRGGGLGRSRRRLVACAVSLCLVVALAPHGTAETMVAGEPGIDECRVRAAFLFNLSRFVYWPPDAFPEASTPIRICLLGDDPLGGALDELARGRMIDGREVTVLREGDAVPGVTCHIVFVQALAALDPTAVLHQQRYAVAVTVSDAPRFTDQGGMIRLYTEARRVRFDINIAEAEAHGLRVSSRLISLASRVTRSTVHR